MRYIYLISALISFFGLAAAIYRLHDVDQDKGLRPDKSVIDFGDVLQGQTHHAVFSVRNDTRQDLVVTAIGKTCNCMEPTIDVPHLPPLATARVTAAWQTKSARGPQLARLLVVYSFRNGKSAVTPLEIRGKVIPDIDFTKPVFSRRCLQTSVHFSSTLIDRVVVADAVCTHNAFTVHAVSATEVAICLRPDAWPWDEPPPSYLRVSTNSPNSPTISVPLEVERDDVDKNAILTATQP